MFEVCARMGRWRPAPLNLPLTGHALRCAAPTCPADPLEPAQGRLRPGMSSVTLPAAGGSSSPACRADPDTRGADVRRAPLLSQVSESNVGCQTYVFFHSSSLVLCTQRFLS